MINEYKRIYGQVRNLTPNELRETFAAIPMIQLAILFGSRAQDRAPAGAASDYDFAVLLDKSMPADWGHLAEARAELGQALRLADCDFDLVDLEVAPQAIKKSIKQRYILIKGTENELCRLLG